MRKFAMGILREIERIGWWVHLGGESVDGS
jgi:hypothetical protein